MTKVAWSLLEGCFVMSSFAAINRLITCMVTPTQTKSYQMVPLVLVNLLQDFCHSQGGDKNQSVLWHFQLAYLAGYEPFHPVYPYLAKKLPTSRTVSTIIAWLFAPFSTFENQALHRKNSWHSMLQHRWRKLCTNWTLALVDIAAINLQPLHGSFVEATTRRLPLWQDLRLPS